MLRRMKVVFIIHELGLNGAVSVLLQQVRRMRARGDSVGILLPQSGESSTALRGAFLETGAN